MGVSVAWQRGDSWADESLALLTPKLWMNWVFDHNEDAAYVPMAFSLKSIDPYLEAAKAATHKTWLLGNEPDLSSTYISPTDAAVFSQRWVAEVGAPMACCGVIVHKDYTGGLQWMSNYLAAGGVVPDYWQIHIYFVQNSFEWQLSLNSFVAWMEANDVVRPIIVSETAMTESGDASALLEYVNSKVDDGTIHASIWYSDLDYWTLWPQSDLRTEGELTELGELYVRLSGLGEPLAEDETEQPGESFTMWLPKMVSN